MTFTETLKLNQNIPFGNLKIAHGGGSPIGGRKSRMLVQHYLAAGTLVAGNDQVNVHTSSGMLTAAASQQQQKYNPHICATTSNALPSYPSLSPPRHEAMFGDKKPPSKQRLFVCQAPF